MNEFLTRGAPGDVVDQLDALQRDLPRSLHESIKRCWTETHPRSLFDALWKTCELLTATLCDVFNSEYVSAGLADARLEAFLRSAADEKGGKMSFGDYVRCLETFASAGSGAALLRIAPEWDDRRFPTSCAEFEKVWGLLKDAKECGVPNTRQHLVKYVEKAGQGRTQGKMNLPKFLWAVGQARNAEVHLQAAESGGASHAQGDPDGWCSAVVNWLAPAVRDLILWPPMADVLRSIQALRVAEGPNSGQADGTVFAEWERATSPPPGRALVSGVPYEFRSSGTLILGRAGADRTRLVFLARLIRFPQALKVLADSRRKFRQLLAAGLFNDGILDDNETKDLDAFATTHQLSDDERRAARSAVFLEMDKLLDWWAKTIADGAIGTPPPSIDAEFGLPELTDPVIASERAAGFLVRAAEKVQERLSETGFSTKRQLAAEIGAPEGLIGRAIERLKTEGKVTELDAATGICSLSQGDVTSRAREVILDYKAGQESAARGSVLPKYVSGFLSVIHDLLGTLPASSGKAQEVQRMIVGLQADAATKQGEALHGAVAQEVAARSELIALEVERTRYEGAGVKGLLQALAGTFRAHGSALRRQIADREYLVGNDARCFVSSGSTHRDGSAFAQPAAIEVDGATITFECNIDKHVFVWHLARLLSDTGVPVRRFQMKGSDVELETTIPTLAEVSADFVSEETVEGEGVNLLFMNLVDTATQQPYPIEGASLREFLCKGFELLWHLREARVREIGTHYAGWRKNLLATEPLHRERPFFAPAKLDEGVYVELDWSPDRGPRVFAELASILGFAQVLDAEDGPDGNNDLLAVVEAWSGLGREPIVGRARNYRRVQVQGLPGGIHYEFPRARGRVTAELHLESRDGAPIVAALDEFARRVRERAPELEVKADRRWFSLGRIIVSKTDAAPSDVAEAMGILVDETLESILALLADAAPNTEPNAIGVLVAPEVLE